MVMVLLRPSTVVSAAVIIWLFSEGIADKIQKVINFVRGLQGRKPLVPVEEDEKTIEWIPVREIVSFVVEEKGFPIDKAKKRFQVRNEKLQAIGERLEELWILSRGENNKRVLAEWIWDRLTSWAIDITISPTAALIKVTPTELKYVENPYKYAENTGEKTYEKSGDFDQENPEKTERIVKDNPELA